MKGLRIYPRENGSLGPDISQSGAFGKISDDIWPDHPRQHHWQVTTPNGDQCSLNPKIHTVVEHEDGTITVHPSIVTSRWHGWLERGVWRSV